MIECPGIFLLLAKCPICCLELVRYFKVKSTGRVLDVSILLEGIGNSHIPVGIRIL